MEVSETHEQKESTFMCKLSVLVTWAYPCLEGGERGQETTPKPAYMYIQIIMEKKYVLDEFTVFRNPRTK